ncbi:MAG: hypothetical protein RL272_66 [Candidatus Parcubacteria bacterium]
MPKESTQSLFRTRIDYDAELNPEQLAVVKNGDGPCVVLAGAGSGKTRTIVYRVAWLLEHGTSPDRVLLLTFTNKAAGEMMTRIGELLGTALPFGSGGVWGGTFHSIANRILRSFASQIGFTPSFSILDEDDSKSLMKATMRELGFTPDGKRFPSPAVVRELLSYSLNAMKTIGEAVAKKHPKFEPLIPDLKKIADAYDEKKRKSNSMDFDDLLVRLHRLLATDPAARERVANRWTYVLVDEYQDTNPLQASLVKLMTGAAKNILVVGDDAQSIYSFRAADVRNILDFPKHYPEARIFKLETNYRSVPEVLNLANDVISRNVDQFPKELRSVKKPFAKPVVAPAPSSFQEASFIVSRIRGLIEDGTRPEDIAVLFRATFHSQTLEFELMKQGIQYDYRGGVKFFDRAHVKDALSFVRIRENFADEAAWLRVLLLQPGVGEVGASRMFQVIRAGGSLAGAVLAPVEQACGARAATGWADLRPVLEKMVETVKPADLVRIVIKSSYSDYLENEYPNWRERLEDIEQLASFAEEYDTCADLLADVTLDTNALTREGARPARRSRGAGGDVSDKIVLSTIHQAKGLEWDAVFVIHLTNSSFPNRKAAMEEGGLEEERRLFYVAVTRAKRRLYLSYPATAGRDMFTIEQPSCFLEECDPKRLDLSLVKGEFAFSAHDTDGFFEDDAITVDDDAPSDPFADMKKRVKQVKRSFLKDV